MIEVWRDIVGYEGFYQVSNTGRVKAVTRKVSAGKNSNHKYLTCYEHLLHPFYSKYVRVQLSRDGKTKCFSVHRLVAEAFIPNPNKLPCVNHKDENPKNNNVNNLEWCTYSYNNLYNGRLEKCKNKISNTLKGRKLNRVLTDEQRENIRRGAVRGWDTRRKNMKIKEDNE